MERLLQSSSCHVPFKIQLKNSPLLPGLCRIDSRRLGFSESRRVNSISCKSRQNPFVDSSSLSVPRSESSLPSNSQLEDSVNGSKPNPNSLDRIYAFVEQRKGTAWRTLIFVASITAILLNPILSPPAFASFQTTTATGGSAAASVGSKLIRTELLSSAWTGFFAGCLHTLSGPDHLAALAPLSIGRTRMESAAVGALWGCGHDAGQLIFGLIFLLLKDRLHIEIIRTWGTRVVGLTLLVIGAMGIKEASEVHAPVVALETGETDMSQLKPEVTEIPKKENRVCHICYWYRARVAARCIDDGFTGFGVTVTASRCGLSGYVLDWDGCGHGKLYGVYRIMQPGIEG